MTPNSPSKKPKEDNQSYPSRALNKLKKFPKSLIKSASQQSSRASTPGPGASSSSSVHYTESGHTASSIIHLSPYSNVPEHPASASAPNLVAAAGTSVPQTATPASYSTHTIESVQPGSEAGNRSQTPSFSMTALEITLRTLHKTSRVFPPLQLTIDSLISCLELFQEAGEMQRSRGDLVSELKNLNEVIAKHSQELESTSMSDCVTNVVECINEEVRKLRKREWASGLRVMGVHADADELAQCVRRIRALLRRLEADVSLSTWSIANEHLANTRLEALSPVRVAGYNSALPEDAGCLRRTCTEGTRTDILSGLNAWSNDPESAKVYWMNGMAGTGKTTIACSLSATLAKRKQLAASFFCTRTLPECRDARRIVPSIAYQLARYSRPFRSALCGVLEREPDIAAESISAQFKKLMNEPLLTVKGAMPSNVVVIVDALDECSDHNGVRAFLNELFHFADSLSIKFFVTSRPEPGISDKILLQPAGARSIIYLHEIERSLVQADIEVYLKEEVGNLVTEAQIKKLAQLSGKLFIYAATIVRYIRPDHRNTVVDPQERLQDILSMKSESSLQYEELDTVYMTILARVLNKKFLKTEELARGRLVLWTAVCAREPITVETLAMLGGLDNRHTRAILQSLRSVLHISESNDLVSPLHASFPDFIFSQQRSQDFFCKESNHAAFLALQCFELMKTGLRFNICRLETSFVLDEAIGDLGERITKHISQTLSYACRYWADHLSAAVPEESICTLLEDFLSKRLLFWMEVLNLAKINVHGISMLQAVQRWLLGGGELSDLSKLVSDAETFLTTFSANPIALSTPHIYISAIPIFRHSIPMLERYWRQIQGLVSIEGSAMEQLGTTALATWNVGRRVASIAVSPDGSMIAFGAHKAIQKDEPVVGWIGILNRYNGKPIVGQFEGHNGVVTSIAFSPDGTRIVSGSQDKTTCVWNTRDGTLVASPFKEHTYPVRSVAFSPDGMRIVSGSSDDICVLHPQDSKLVAGPFRGGIFGTDISAVFSPDGAYVVSGPHFNTIYMWDAHGDKLTIGPFEGDIPLVHTATFSSDCTRVVSGCDDGMIHMCKIQDSTLVASSHKGHTSIVSSVAFSSDGSRIVSGSWDRTICVWDVQDGKLLAGPFRGHTGSVTSVSFLPGNTRIVSGSVDSTISVWNAQDGKFVADLLEGHTNMVVSAAISRDASRIVSGSFDGTICVWSARDGKLIAGPFKGDPSPPLSIAFSPDATRIVSRSSNDVIHVWDAQDGKLVTSQFKEYPSTARSVAFSPDGTRIVSGNHDKTICVWDAQTAKLMAGPFEGHFDSVLSVAFSPDGTYITSGSQDNTVCVWNAQDGKLVADPFKGHTKSVLSVAFSSDGAQIVSGSLDKEICVLNAHDGKLFAGPFKGHTDAVRSVAFSSDDRRIVSGSNDKTICVWDAQTGQLLAGPFEHADPVASVAFSPDGAHIISSSLRSLVRITHLQGIRVPTQALDGEWVLELSGWVLNRAGQHLFWVPPRLHPSLPRPYQSVALGLEGALRVDYSDLFIGDEWSRCYVGE